MDFLFIYSPQGPLIDTCLTSSVSVMKNREAAKSEALEKIQRRLVYVVIPW